MKFSLPILLFALLSFFNAPAQVSVEITMDQSQFLPSESIPLAVRITNRSGQTLHLGADAAWLTFSVESEDGFVVVKNADVPVLGAFDLGSSEVATKNVDLQPYFDLEHPGRYRVTAILRINDWNVQVTSAPKMFDIITGAKLWSQDFGLPTTNNQLPEVRKYTLQKANYLRSQLRLYVEVSDESESHVFKVLAIGPMVSFSLPEEQLDKTSNLHVLYQSGARSFIYSVINPGGNIIQQETYDYYDTRPRMGLDTNSDIVVIGGVHRIKSDDLPVIKSPAELAAPAQP